MSEHRYSIPRWMSILYRTGQMYLAARFEHLDIGKGQLIFLNALYRQDGMTQEEISYDLRIDKGTTAKALKKLEEQGYIVRLVRANDKRSYSVHLTEKALAIQDEVRQGFAEWRSLLLQGLSEEEQERMLDSLEKMGRNAAEVAAKFREGDRQVTGGGTDIS
ncbi:MarR family winged helix-turn-helix transcriptional regulator [Paenibacillus chartarius]|uniref:MarR family winged helix-turn-helix transcriptional regulator n=1 Tax=Paenibacillus chartarius TaxID=747481 RepID=A0ABV6DJH9_9BACL